MTILRSNTTQAETRQRIVKGKEEDTLWNLPRARSNKFALRNPNSDNIKILDPVVIILCCFTPAQPIRVRIVLFRVGIKFSLLQLSKNILRSDMYIPYWNASKLICWSVRIIMRVNFVQILIIILFALFSAYIVVIYGQHEWTNVWDISIARWSFRLS